MSHPHLRRGLLTAALLTAALAAPAAATAQAPAPGPGTVSAIGTSSVTPKPADANSNDSIAAAVREARRAAIPRAVSDARNRAALLAAAGGLKLGALIGLADVSSSPFFGSPFGQDGTFGPGRFCGPVARFRTTRTSDGRVRRRVVGRTRRCRVPRQVTATETVTFATVS